MTDTTVKIFDSSMAGAPSLSNVAGNLIALLDACLVDGFGLKSVDSLVISGGIATVTVNTGQPAKAGAVVLLAGIATPAALNGEQRVLTAATNTFTFDATGIADQAATGTITVKLAPAGWQKAFASTNKGAYKSANPQASGRYVRVDDTGTTNARIVGYETMSDVDTGVNPFPTAAQLSGGAYLPKSGSAGAKKWWLIANSKFVYIGVAHNATYADGYTVCAFGDIASKVAADAYHFGIFAKTTDIASSAPNGENSAPFAAYATGLSRHLARGYAQTGGSQVVTVKWIGSDVSANSTSGSTANALGVPYPNPADNAVVLAPILVYEGTGIRGELPGAYASPQGIGVAIQNDFVLTDTPVAGKNVAYKQLGAGTSWQGGAFLDVTGPWAN